MYHEHPRPFNMGVPTPFGLDIRHTTCVTLQLFSNPFSGQSLVTPLELLFSLSHQFAVSHLFCSNIIFLSFFPHLVLVNSVFVTYTAIYSQVWLGVNLFLVWTRRPRLSRGYAFHATLLPSAPAPSSHSPRAPRAWRGKWPSLTS